MFLLGWLMVALSFGLGCSGAKPPDSMLELRRNLAKVEGKEGSRLDSAREYLHSANVALEEGDSERAALLCELGLLETRVYEVGQNGDLTRLRIEKEEASLGALQLELEEVEGEVDQVRRQLTRRRMRAHIEAVIEKEFLEAAAAEELDEAKLNKADKEALFEARMVVARELVALAEVRGLAVRALTGVGALESEQATNLLNLVKMARESMERQKLVDVYRYTEASIEAYAALLASNQPEPEGDEYAAKVESLVGDLTAAGNHVTREKIGLAIGLSIKKGKLGKGAREVIGRVAETIGGDPGLAVGVVTTGSVKADRPVALRSSVSAARSILDAFSDNGLEGDTLPVLELENQSPLETLKGDKAQACILLVPAP